MLEVLGWIVVGVTVCAVVVLLVAGVLVGRSELGGRDGLS